MTDIKNDVDKEDDKTIPTEHEETLGTILKHAREEKQLSQQDAAAKLHLRVSIVADIENDEFGNIASSTYVRGYVRNYARFLEIDAPRIEACLTRQVPMVAAPVMQSFSRKTTQKNWDKWLMVLTYLIVIVSLALLVLWWLQKPAAVTENFSKPTVEELQSEPSSVADSSTSEADNNSGPKAEDTPIEVPGAVVSDASQSQEPAPQNEAMPDAAVTAATSDVTAPATTVPQAVASDESLSAVTSAQLAISLKGDCWIKALDADGKTLVDGLKSAGHNIAVSGKPPISLVLGAPQSVSVSYNGTAVDLTPFPEGRVARLTLPKA
ncbi:DUF4115 domain-containing protein [Shewanella sp. A32]|uniref:RodZ domain-containing protein n=1 Tax=Shewanella sp. A32 TaxID=3031327 RepID=UPI0023BA1924|nr:RodZ domain-containing protein [Shewanella sp. A32]MDF0534834.1 DUF4115 domain-containing protein [Shewanella sp. A32]